MSTKCVSLNRRLVRWRRHRQIYHAENSIENLAYLFAGYTITCATVRTIWLGKYAKTVFPWQLLKVFLHNVRARSNKTSSLLQYWRTRNWKIFYAVLCSCVFNTVTVKEICLYLMMSLLHFDHFSCVCREMKLYLNNKRRKRKFYVKNKLWVHAVSLFKQAMGRESLWCRFEWL